MQNPRRTIFVQTGELISVNDPNQGAGFNAVRHPHELESGSFENPFHFFTKAEV